MPLVFVGFWIVLLFVLTDLTPTSMGPLGDALAPLGTVLVFYGLLSAFSQQREERQQAHLDRVADAYARWIPLARSKLREAERLSNACKNASMRKNDPVKLREVRIHNLSKIGPLFEEIAIASTEVLLFEQDAALRQRVQGLTRIPSMFPEGIGGRHHNAVVLLSENVKLRRIEAEKLVADVATRLGGTVVDPVDVVEAEDPPGDEQPASEDE